MRATLEAPWAPESTDAERLEVHATALLAEVMEAVAPGSAALGRFPHVGELATAQLEARWRETRVVSFDIFDTLIVRKVAAPSDVFLHLAGLAPFAVLTLDPHELARERQLAEHTARVTARAARGSVEVSLAEIHEALATRLGLELSAVPQMVRAEQLIEQALCVAHPTLSGWFARARSDGRPIWCVSDTYHDAEFLRTLLTGCGYDVSDVIVVSSADERCSKGDGRLLPRISSAQGVIAADVLHIGDNTHADCHVPTRLGFVGTSHPWAAARPTDEPATAPGDSVAIGLSALAARTIEPPMPFWWRFGYATAGPLLSGFALWLHHRFRRDGITRAYFLLRDGEILEAVYRALIGDRPGPVTSLLESSRRAFALPALEAGKPSLLAQLTVTENARPAREFLDRVGVAADAHRADFAAVGFHSLDEVIAPEVGDGLARVAALMSRPAVTRALIDRSRAERRLLVDFLDTAGVTAPGRVALVDIGWNGTIQRALTAVLELERRTASVHGYYLGAASGAKREMAATSTVSGYLFSGGEPTDRHNTIMQFRQLIEFICTTSRGSLRGFTRDAQGRVQPVHGSPDHTAANQEAHAQLRAGALAYAAALRDECAMFGFQQISPDAAMRSIARTILQPTAEEAELIGDIGHGEGLGSDRSRALAAFQPGAWTSESVLHDLRTSYWPTGLRSRRDPRALVLRTMDWLSGAHDG
jgi:predicted HAD superfamily hydrolase